MDMRTEDGLKPKNFWEAYQKEIAPRLREIDIQIKSMEEPMTARETAVLLDIDEEEALAILADMRLSCIDQQAFFAIMRRGSGKICQLYNREVECGSPFVYKREDIAYIYDLDLSIVNSVCDGLGILEATSWTLPLLFAHIPLA